MQTAAWVDNDSLNSGVQLRRIEIETPKSGQVLVKLEVTGVCHSDCDFVSGKTPMSNNNHIAGHEGIGRIVKVGPNVSDTLLDTRVGVSFLHRTCGFCEICAVDETHCPNQDNTGRNVPGTFQQYVLADAGFVYSIPDGLSSAVVAPLLCGGITMYGAIVKCKLNPGDYIVLPGAGGGLGHLGVQIASYLGYRVIALDAGSEKRDLCLSLGAHHFIDFATTKDIQAAVIACTGMGAHAVICVAGSPSAYNSAIAMLRNCGTLVCVGIPPPEFRLSVNPFELLVRGINISGASVGSRAQMKELLDLASKGAILPHYEVFPFTQLASILHDLETYKIKGRAVLSLDHVE
ncbi:hypothetical protein LTR02_016480 [Friedmanniomyces endolithicus]|nr:hypothetical protein LTR02_016480 [Friedmanniomyces endolithicus]